MKSAWFRKFLTFVGSLLLVVTANTQAGAPTGTPAQVPLYLSITAVPPNIMLMVDTSGSMSTTVTGTTSSRMTIAKAAAQNLVTQLTPAIGAPTSVRLGLAAYNGSIGGKLLYPLTPLTAPTNTTPSAPATAIKNAIGTMTANGVTPLATTLSDIGYYYTTGYNFLSSSQPLNLPHAHGPLGTIVTPAPYLDTAINIFKKTTDTNGKVNFAGFTPPTAPSPSALTGPGQVACPLITHVITPADAPLANGTVPPPGEIHPPSDYAPSGCAGTAVLPSPSGSPTLTWGGTTTTATGANTPVQMVVIGSSPTFCMTNPGATNSTPACHSETVFKIGNGLSKCTNCSNSAPTGATLTAETLSFTAPTTSPSTDVNTGVTGAIDTAYNNLSLPGAPYNIGVGSTVQVTQTPSVATTATLGYSLSDPTLLAGVCSIGTNGLVTGLDNGICRMCSTLPVVTTTSYTWTGGTGAAATPPTGTTCTSSNVGAYYCPAWNNAACSTVGTGGGYYTNGANSTAIPSTSLSSCAVHSGHGTGKTYSPDGTNYYTCATCGCYNSSTCVSGSSAGYCSNSSNACSYGATGADSSCYTASCGGICSNNTLQSCTQDSTCQTATCGSGKCSNDNALSCSQDSTCQTATCGGGLCSDYATSCNTASDCATATCSSVSGSGTRYCSNDSNTACTQNSNCNFGTCSTGSSTHTFCVNNTGIRCNGSDAACDNVTTPGIACGGSVNVCSNSHTTKCLTSTDCVISGVTCSTSNKACSDNGSACTDNSTCPTNSVLTCVTSNGKCTNSGIGCTADSLCSNNLGVTCSGSSSVCSNSVSTVCSSASTCNSGVTCSGSSNVCSTAPTQVCSNASTCPSTATCSGSRQVCSNSTTTACSTTDTNSTCPAVTCGTATNVCSNHKTTVCSNASTCTDNAGVTCPSTTVKRCSNNLATTCTGTANCGGNACTSYHICSNQTKSCNTANGNADCYTEVCGGTGNTNGLCSNSTTTTCTSGSISSCPAVTCSGSSSVCSTGTNQTCSSASTCPSNAVCGGTGNTSAVCSNNTSLGCSTAANCYTNTCGPTTSAVCSNNTSQTCSTAANCYTETCNIDGYLRCSNNGNRCNTSYGGISGACYTATCATKGYKICSSTGSSCTSASNCVACGGTGNTSSVCSNAATNNGVLCSSVSDCDGSTSSAATDLCLWYNYCQGVSGNTANSACTTGSGGNAYCTNGICSGTCSNTGAFCTSNSQCQVCNNTKCSDTGTACSSAATCNTGKTCNLTCSDSPSTPCTSATTCNSTNHTCTNTFCITGGVTSTTACSLSNNNTDCNIGVSCKQCATVTPAQCNATTTGTGCAESQLDIVVGNGISPGVNPGGGTNDTGGTLSSNYFCFNDNQYYTIQYNGSPDVMVNSDGTPYNGAQLNWYFSQVNVPNSSPAITPAFIEGSLEMPNYTTNGTACTCTCINPDNTSSTTDTTCTGTSCSPACSCTQSYSTNLPIQYWCQKSFAVLVSDGLPNQDRTVNPVLRNYIGNCGSGLPCDAASNSLQMPGTGTLLQSCTGTVTAGSSTQCNKTGGACNKACQNGSKANRAYETGGSDYLDDVAYALYDTDLRPDLQPSDGSTKTGKNNVTTFTIGFDDPSVTGNSTTSTSVLQDAATRGGGQFFPATGAAGLTNALNAVKSAISAQVGSSASVATNSTQIGGDTLIYQAKFDSGGWYGDLNAFSVYTTTTTGTGAHNIGDINTQVWDAATLIPTDDGTTMGRTILTYNPSTPAGTAFTWGGLSASQQASLQATVGSSTTTAYSSLGQWRLNYIRGDKTHEQTNPKRADTGSETRLASNTLIFRNRTRLDSLTKNALTPDPWVLGDIVASNPVYVSNQNYGYTYLPSTTAEALDSGHSYNAFITTGTAATRRSMVYVGANDGMLHGFDGLTGVEKVAYVPNGVYSNLANFTDPSYVSNHHYFVDGSPAIGDIYSSGGSGTVLSQGWHTILVGTTGAGGEAVFALDVTSSSSFGTGNVLWEVSNTAPSTSADVTTDTAAKRGFGNNLGYTMSQAAIVRTHDASNPWVAIVANGYYSTNNHAILYILNIQTGAIIRTIDAINANDSAFTGQNGLSSPFAADVDGDAIADYVYAGDLRGNMWKFDLTSTAASNWGVANGGVPLYTACDRDAALPCTAAERQPISTRPQVGLEGVPVISATTGTETLLYRYMVYFGTGKYFDSGDSNLTNAQRQTFYGIVDRGITNPLPPTPIVFTVPSSGSTTRGTLQNQGVTDTTAQNGANWRTTSDNTCENDGWFMDLPDTGERVTTFPLLHGDRVIFATLVPLTSSSTETCSVASTGTGWLMELGSACGTPVGAAVTTSANTTIANGSTSVTTTGSGTTTTVTTNVAVTTTAAGASNGTTTTSSSSGNTTTVTKVVVSGTTTTTTTTVTITSSNNNNGTAAIAATNKGAWDVSGDGTVDSSDATYSGMQSSVGVPTTPGIIALDPSVAPGLEEKYVTGSSGAISNFTETYSSSPSNTTAIPGKRQSWRQIR